jgi:NEDD8-activating enzyme E1
MIDGGTEGFKGHARVILPAVTPCFDCTLWLFPPQVTYPLCTLAETPRSAAHCIEYAHLILWDQQRPGVRFDADNEEHMQWVWLHLNICKSGYFQLCFDALELAALCALV